MFWKFLDTFNYDLLDYVSFYVCLFFLVCYTKYLTNNVLVNICNVCIIYTASVFDEINNNIYILCVYLLKYH